MTITELLQTTDCGTWAAEFVRFKNENKWTLEDIDEGLMQGWFANAMCAASDPRDREIEELEEEYDTLEQSNEKLCIRIAELEKRILDAPAIIGKELQRQYPSVDYLRCIAEQEAESALGIANYRPDKREVE